jgi:Family of unknown function (DUF5682)
MEQPTQLDPRIYQTDGDVVFFPVRHHSPAAARIVQQLIQEIKPTAIAIEGPSDFNAQISELFLPHQLPIAIYSYIQTTETRRGAFYPFCIYSPEWQALQSAHECNIPVEFIDLPWADSPTDRTSQNCYSDESFNHSNYIDTLCQKLGLPDFDTLWDTLFEIDPNLSIAEYLERCHQFCYHLRTSEHQSSSSDQQRETFMAEQIRSLIAKHPGKILVVTGGFHSYPLYRSIVLNQNPPEISIDLTPIDNFIDPMDLSDSIDPLVPKVIVQGIALTPYSYDRLDNLTGYNSGMPNPGFYHAVWQQRSQHNTSNKIIPAINKKPDPQAKSLTPSPLMGEGWGEGESTSHSLIDCLLSEIITFLRQRQQIASTADLIAVKALAQGLADLRSHPEIWRQDLIDGVIGGLVKEDTGKGTTHPFLAAVQAVFRGGDRGQLAAGTTLPPLVQDLHQQLHHLDIFPTNKPRDIDLDLTPNKESTEHPPRPISALLHSMRILGITGCNRTGGTNFTTRQDLVKIWERWQLQWSPEFDASSIEAAIYGATVAEATVAKLRERADRLQRNAEGAALLLLDAGLAGVQEFTPEFYPRLVELIRQDGDFLSIARSLRHLLYLYRYDEILGTRSQTDLAAILVEAFQRGLWLLDSLGTTGEDRDLLKGLAGLLEAYECCGSLLLDRKPEFIQVLERVSQDASQTAVIRGGSIGVLWVLGVVGAEDILATINYYCQPDSLGDFLTGLFYLARETTQRAPGLLLSIDKLLLAYEDNDFLEALPSLRLAFGYFTPREKHLMAKNLLQSTGATGATGVDTSELLTLPVRIEDAIQAIELESRLFALADRYGFRQS